MTPEQAVKWLILSLNAEWTDSTLPENPSGEEIDDLWDEAEELWDVISETRGGDVETNIDADYSRHYESKSVASRLPNGQWVGWTYWYGGGKHGEPEAIDWMNKAYFLDCEEKEVTVIQRIFTKKGE